MQINGALVKELRLKRSWSQEDLAEKAKINLRTVQRVESTGGASLRTRRSIASALEVESLVFDLQTLRPSATAGVPARPRLTAGSILVGLYALSVIILFGFVVLDQVYFLLIEQEVVVTGSARAMAEVADFLLQFTVLVVLLGVAAAFFIRRARRARFLFLASAVIGMLLPIAVVVTFGAVFPDVGAVIERNGIGPVIRFTLHAAAAALAVWCWLEFSSDGNANAT
jgi:DNA-binding XRE family transcriptional regulator